MRNLLSDKHKYVTFFEENGKRAVFRVKYTRTTVSHAALLCKTCPETVIRRSDPAWKVESGEKYLFFISEGMKKASAVDAVTPNER